MREEVKVAVARAMETAAAMLVAAMVAVTQVEGEGSYLGDTVVEKEVAAREAARDVGKEVAAREVDWAMATAAATAVVATEVVVTAAEMEVVEKALGTPFAPATLQPSQSTSR